jgi:2-amino-4-hydroxy-6-hydroxymethyldihydropteridine diphosphokinase
LSALYLIGLGSNMRHPRYGSPRAVLDAAVARLEECDLPVLAFSPVIRSCPLGPSQREFANAAVVVESDLEPETLLALLQGVEAQFGRNRIGQPWRARVLDLDILLWNGGIFASKRLSIPHPQMALRGFVLSPAAVIAGDWRDPVSGRTLAQLLSILGRPKEKGPTKRPDPFIA